jgi:hypothetical protein
LIKKNITFAVEGDILRQDKSVIFKSNTRRSSWLTINRTSALSVKTKTINNMFAGFGNITKQILY